MTIFEAMESWLAGEPVWPLARIAKEFPQFIRGRFDNPGTEDFMARHNERNDWIKRYGFAIPCAELLDELALSARVVEVGAGTGYMTRLMRYRGIGVIGSDRAPRGVNGYGFLVGKYDALQKTGVALWMVREHPAATIFCSWPSLNETWFREMLKAMRIGQRLVVIREQCCAEDGAWTYIDDCFDEERSIALPHFDYIDDYAASYIKRRHKRRKNDAEIHDRGDELREQRGTGEGASAGRGSDADT